MRLAQLARKLSIRPSQLVTFLAEHNITPEEGLNARLADEHVTLIISHFSPGMLDEIKSEISQPSIKEAPVPTPVEPEPVVIETATEPVVSQENDLLESKEIIKAPKIELTGLKVLGKIELPEPKKKIVVADQQETNTVEVENRPLPRDVTKMRKPKPPTRVQPPRPYKNPVALQREQEEREAEEKRRERLEQEKEKKRLHYLNKVKMNTPPKVKRFIDEPVEESKQNPPPRTFWGKFVRWWNGNRD